MAAKHSVNAAHKALKIAINLESTEVAALKNNLKKAKQFQRSICRRELHKDDLRRDTELFSVFGSSSQTFKSIRVLKSSSGYSVPYITVGEKTYPGNMIGDMNRIIKILQL